MNSHYLTQHTGPETQNVNLDSIQKAHLAVGVIGQKYELTTSALLRAISDPSFKVLTTQEILKTYNTTDSDN